MTTAPTEEMRERAREIIAALAYDPDVKGKDAELVARALAEQDRLAVERCAELADAWAAGRRDTARYANSEADNAELRKEALILELFAKHLRVQGRSDNVEQT